MNKTRRSVAALLLAIQVAGCSKTVILDEPGPYVESQRPGKVWITETSGKERKLLSPRVISDTIFGWNDVGQQTMFPLTGLTSVRARETAIVPTLALGLAAMVGMAIVAKLVKGDDMNSIFQDIPEDGVVPSN